MELLREKESQLILGTDTDINYAEVPPVFQKRSIAFVNHFILRTVTFLNKFASSCDSKFLDFEHKLQKIEANISILESKLASIPELNDVSMTNLNNYSENTTVHDDNEGGNLLQNVLPTVNKSKTDLSENTEEIHNGICIKSDPRYAKYFKMLHVGVPEEAVKLKMQSDGIDTNILSEPNKIIEKQILDDITNIQKN